MSKSSISQSYLKFVDQNRKKLQKKYKTFDSFKSSYDVPQELIDMVLESAKKEKIEYNDSILEKTLPMLKLQLKALIARDLWEMNEYYQIMNEINNIYVRGLAALKDEHYDDRLSKWQYQYALHR